MDIFTGIVSALVGLGTAGLALFFAKGYISGMVWDSAEEFVQSKLQEIADNPKILQPFVRPLINSAMEELTGQNPGTKPRSLNIAGFKVPPEVYMPFVARFASGMTSGAQNAAAAGVKDLLKEMV